MESEKSLDFHLKEVLAGNRKFENVFQSVDRMIREQGITTRKILGREIDDFDFFRQGKKPLIGMYHELNALATFIHGAAEGGSAKEMAIVFVGEPGNGKTYLVDYVCDRYRDFLSLEGNERFTFKFVGLDKLGKYAALTELESQTYEDPMILAMRLFGSAKGVRKKNIEFLRAGGFTLQQLEEFYDFHDRHLAADSDYILRQIREFTGGDIKKILNHIEIVPVPLSPTLGTVTGKYAAGDKITSSAVDLVGERSIERGLYIGSDFKNPARYDIQIGALARVGGGGIHFADEMFKNKPDLILIYLGVIQNRLIEQDSFRWPLDTLIIATSNNSEFNEFIEDKKQSPIWDRCRIVHMSHNTDYRLQQRLTSYAIGETKRKTTIQGKKMHIDPNLSYALSAAVVLTRIPPLIAETIGGIEAMKLAAGEISEEKNFESMWEAIEELSHNKDTTSRFGQKGLGQRDLGKALQILLEVHETNQGSCMGAKNGLEALERVIYDYSNDDNERTKYLENVNGSAKKLYRERVLTTMFNAYMEDKDAVKESVRNYVNMIVALTNDRLGKDKTIPFRNPSGKLEIIKVDESWVEAVEQRMGLRTEEQRKDYRKEIIEIFAQKQQERDDYDYMDQQKLVRAVTEVRLNSDVNGEGSLVGALLNQSKRENRELRSRLLRTMQDQGYCQTCAEETIKYYSTHVPES